MGTKIQYAYGVGAPLIPVFPPPIRAQRAPTSSDTDYPAGQLWYDESVNPPLGYEFDGGDWDQGGGNPATTTTYGTVLLTDNNQPVATQDYVDNIAIAGAPVSTTTTAGIGELATDAEAVAGTASTGLLALFVTPSNLAPVFAANPPIGGTTPAAATFTSVTASATGTGNTFTSDTASNFSVTGAGVDVTVDSASGRVVLNGEEAAADAVRVLSAAGGLDVDVALLASITSTRNNAQAILLEATAGGVDILASGAGAGEDIDIIATGSSVNITATENAADAVKITASAGGIDILATGAATEDIDIVNTGGSVNISATENDAGAITIGTNGGTSERITVTCSQGTNAASIGLTSTAGGLTLTAGLGTADAINLVTSNAAGGIDVDAGTGGIAVDTTGAAVVTSTANSAASIYLRANGGTSETVKIHADQGTGVASLDLLSDVGGITLTAGVASADAINIVTSNAAGGIDIDAGTAGIIADTTGAISLDGAAASNFTVTGAGIDLTLASAGGSVLVSSTEDAALAIRLHANGGTSETIQIHADQGTGVASVGLLSDVGGITVRSTGLASADAINLEAAAGGIDVDAALQINIASSQNAADSIVITSSAGGIDILASGAAAGEDIDIVATGSSVNISATESAADSITIISTAGGIDILASGAAAGEDIDIVATGSSVNISSTESAADSIKIESTAGGIDILASGAAAGEDIDIIATGSSINVTATEAAANAIVLTASNAAGGIDLTTGGGSIDLSSAGSVTMVAGTDSQAGDTCTINKNVFAATFTGFTTASAASQVFNVTNSVITATSQVILTLCNEGANDAQMTIQRVKRGTGTIAITAKNNGAAALNGNVTITGWVIG